MVRESNGAKSLSDEAPLSSVTTLITTGLSVSSIKDAFAKDTSLLPSLFFNQCMHYSLCSAVLWAPYVMEAHTSQTRKEKNQQQIILHPRSMDSFLHCRVFNCTAGLLPG